MALSKPRPSAVAIRQWQGSKFIHFGFSQLGGVWQGKQSGNGLARTVILKEGSQTKFDVGADHILEFPPPPEPFAKGTPLPLTIRSIDFVPSACE